MVVMVMEEVAMVTEVATATEAAEAIMKVVLLTVLKLKMDLVTIFFDPQAPEPPQPTADWYKQRDAFYYNDENVVDVDDSAVNKRQRFAYLPSAYGTLITVFFFLQLVYMITCLNSTFLLYYMLVQCYSI